MDSDSSNYYETTYSEDERIEKYVKEQRERERNSAEEKEKQREILFKNYYDEKCDDVDSIFKLPGMRFLKFTSQKIKFAFQPCHIATLISEKLTFYISLKYRYNNYWVIRRDSIPVNYKLKIYNSFYEGSRFKYTDENIAGGIREVWLILKTWALNEHKFREDKFKKFQDGMDVYFDGVDEELFLSVTEIEARHKKKEDIWKRMLPPKCNRRLRRKRL